MEPPGVLHRSDPLISVGSASGVVVEPVYCDEGDHCDMQIQGFWPISRIGGYGEVIDIKMEEDDDLHLAEGNSHKRARIVGIDDPLISVHDHLLPTKSELDDNVDYPAQNPIVVYENTSCAPTEQHNFCLGDTVWIESEINSWWPGLICDPVKDSFPIPQNPGMDLFLVRYIDEWSFSWRVPSQIKHFSDGYNQLSKSNQSRRFHLAVKKAVEEIRKCAIQSVSCPCLSKEIYSENYPSVSLRREPSVIPFEPSDFLRLLKSASYSPEIPNQLEIMVIQSYLLVFYTFMDLCRLPQLGLDDSVVTEEDIPFHGAMMPAGVGTMCSSPRKKLDCRKRITEKRTMAVLNLSDQTNMGVDRDDVLSEKKTKRGYESRQRRRSKYLSPPYVDVSCSGKYVSEDCTPSVIQADSFSNGREDNNLSVVIGLAARPCPGMGGGRVRKKVTKLHKLCVSFPLEMLDMLHLLATGCCMSAENGFISSISELFFRFRNSVFRGGSDYGFHGEHELGDQEEFGTDTDSLGLSFECSTHSIGPENICKRMKKTTPKTEENSVLWWQGDSNIGWQNGIEGLVHQKNTQANYRIEWKPTLNKNIPDLDEKLNPNSTALVVRELEADTKCENLPQMSPGSTPDSSGDKRSWLIDPYSSESGLLSFQDPSPLLRNGGRSKPNSQTSSTTTIVPDLNKKTDDILPLPIYKTGVTSSRKNKKQKPDKGRLQGPVNGPGNTLLLSFDEGCPPPTKDALIQAFCSFGELIESETEQANGSAEARVGFQRSCDAGEAFRSLEKVNPFGQSLIKYRLQHQSGATRPPNDREGITSATPLLIRPAVVTPVKTVYADAPVIATAPSLPLIRRNLEAMTEVLEVSGDSLSPETRVKLEEEIKGLLKKVSTMTSSPFQ